MKIDFIADTNFLIYLQEGNEVVRPLLESSFGISFISELELLGHKGLTQAEASHFRKIIQQSFYLDWNNEIKEQTIRLRQKHTIKLPDAIIAATALTYSLPLVTADKGFEKITTLDLLLLDV